jgi:hypothetical protein
MAKTLKSELKKWFKHWYLGSRDAVQFLTPEAVEEEKAYYKYISKELIDRYIDSFAPVLEVKKKKK